MKSQCLYCKIEFSYSPSSTRGKYCSNKCQGLYKVYHETAPRVERGEVNQINTLKRYLTEVNGYSCVECGVGKLYNNKPLTLQVDHIDGNSDNNFPDNLRLLCPNCHSQTDTFCTRQKKDTKRNRYLRKYKGYAL